jgi:hypothetical protein
MNRWLGTAVRLSAALSLCVCLLASAAAFAQAGPQGAPPAAQPAPKLLPGQTSPAVQFDAKRKAVEEAEIAAAKAAEARAEAARAAALKKPGAQWYRGNVITLNAAEPNAGFKATWRFERTEANDIRLTLDEQRKAGPQRGTVMIIGQKALLTRELTLARAGGLMPAVDGPTLLLNLTLRMLERAVPDGPQSVRRERTVSVKDGQSPISIETPSAKGVFLAPWQLTGKVARRGDDVEFDLLLVSRSRSDAKGTNNTVLRGSWRNEERMPPVLPDDVALQGWSLHAIVGVPKEVNRQQAIVYDAIPRQGFASLGDLRRAIELGWPGQPDTAFHKK